MKHACCNPNCEQCNAPEPPLPFIGLEESARRNEVYAEKRRAHTAALGLAPSAGRGTSGD